MLRPFISTSVTDEVIVRSGGHNITRWAKWYNHRRYAAKWSRHQAAYNNRWDQLLRDNNGGDLPPRRLQMSDGWVRDDSHSLPHLDRVLEQADRIATERGGRRHSFAQQPFLRHLLFPGDLEQFPALLDFITSSEVLDVAARHLGTVPVLSKTRPPGVRFMESNAALDPNDGGPYRESQWHHLDLHDTPLVYVLVMVRDIPPEAGPWTFLPQSVSDRAAAALRYREPGVAYRVTDEAMYGVVDRSEEIVFSGRRGDVLFIDSSRCFHYGSRHCLIPRFQLMYGLTSPCRGDFSQTFMQDFPYPLDGRESDLRRMVLGS